MRTDTIRPRDALDWPPKSNQERIMSDKALVDDLKKTAQPADQQKTPQVQDTPDEMALDVANELSFPASDPVAVSNITRIEQAPETASAADDHQDVEAVKKAEVNVRDSPKAKA
jgi:protease I